MATYIDVNNDITPLTIQFIIQLDNGHIYQSHLQLYFTPQSWLRKFQLHANILFCIHKTGNDNAVK